jgi:hypothetical protein
MLDVLMRPSGSLLTTCKFIHPIPGHHLAPSEQKGAGAPRPTPASFSTSRRCCHHTHHQSMLRPVAAPAPPLASRSSLPLAAAPLAAPPIRPTLIQSVCEGQGHSPIRRPLRSLVKHSPLHSSLPPLFPHSSLTACILVPPFVAGPQRPPARLRPAVHCPPAAPPLSNFSAAFSRPFESKAPSSNPRLQYERKQSRLAALCTPTHPCAASATASDFGTGGTLALPAVPLLVPGLARGRGDAARGAEGEAKAKRLAAPQQLQRVDLQASTSSRPQPGGRCCRSAAQSGGPARLQGCTCPICSAGERRDGVVAPRRVCRVNGVAGPGAWEPPLPHWDVQLCGLCCSGAAPVLCAAQRVIYVYWVGGRRHWERRRAGAHDKRAAPAEPCDE